MSATFIDSSPVARGQLPPPGVPTMDLDTTMDLQPDNTTDLAPATADIEPAVLTGATAAVPPARPPAPDERTLDEPHPLRTADEPRAARAAELHQAVQQRAQPAPGTVLCDRYLLEQLIGSGGTAVVYQARDLSAASGSEPNARLAIKIPRPQSNAGGRAAKRLRHEFDHATRLAHPNIVRVLELHQEPAPGFMTMELIKGRLLSTILRDWTMLPPPLARKILRACADALAHAHQLDVVHGDFKPGNVFVTAEEDVKIVDFGAAAASSTPGSSNVASSRIAAGTPAYASPEVLSGELPDRRDDIFSFACVAYELLTGQHPFEHRSSLEARAASKIPPRAWNLSAAQWLALRSALSWERAQRPAEIASLLQALTADHPPSTHLPSAPLPVTTITTDLPQELMPRQRGWGFFVFVACALAVTFIASQQRQSATSEGEPTTLARAPAGVPMAAALPLPRGGMSADLNPFSSQPIHLAAAAPLGKVSLGTGPGAAQQAPVAPAPTPAKATTPASALSEITFEAGSITTSESSVAAVFLIKRSQPLKGRVRVQWNATSATADAGIDFASDAAGSVEFADGQAQRAIYVPLRNDLLPEQDETFNVRLHSPQQARLGVTPRAQATIRDDD